MRGALAKLLVVAAFTTALIAAIRLTSSESVWLGVWFLLFIFLGVPLALLSTRDLLISLLKRKSESSHSWLLLHVCAVFAALIGLGLGYMAKASSHPKADLHQWLVLVLPGLVYLVPILLAVQAADLGFLRSLAQMFRRRSREE